MEQTISRIASTEQVARHRGDEEGLVVMRNLHLSLPRTWS